MTEDKTGAAPRRRSKTRSDSKSRKTPPKDKTEKISAKKTVSARRLTQIRKQIHDVLFELMATSPSDTVRVSAAKALMEKLEKGGDGDDETRRAKEKRAAAVREAERLLEELAQTKSRGADGTGLVDPNGAPGSTDPAG